MEPAGLLKLFDEHHLPLFRFAWRMTGSVADAEEIVQECFLQLLRPGSAFDPGRSPARTYLFGVVRNQALKRFRSAAQAASHDRRAVSSPESEFLRSELENEVARAIARLPAGQKEALILAHYEQLSLTEIAQIMDIEVTAVKSRLQRARASLKESLAAYAPEHARKS